MLRSNQEGNFCKEYVLHRLPMFDRSSRSFGLASNLGASPMTVGAEGRDGTASVCADTDPSFNLPLEREGLQSEILRSVSGMPFASNPANSSASTGRPK